MQLDSRGWLNQGQRITHAPSPNYNLRPAHTRPYLLVIHNISLPPNQFSGTAVIDFFQNQLDFEAHPWFEHIRDLKVSAHFFIRRCGRLIQLVSTEHRAWHAGLSQFEQTEQCNDFSIGIELEGADTIPYTPEQYAALAELSQALCNHYPIRSIRGHEHIAPGRKTDPGPAFNWNTYAQLSQLPAAFFLSTESSS